MSFEEEFDKNVRQKMDEASYPFDQDNWEKASQMIDADRKAAVAGKLSKLYIPALVIGAVSLGIATFGIFKKDATAVAALNVPSPIREASAPVRNETLAQSSSAKKEETSVSVPVTNSADRTEENATPEQVNVSAKKNQSSFVNENTTTKAITEITENNLAQQSQAPQTGEANVVIDNNASPQPNATSALPVSENRSENMVERDNPVIEPESGSNNNVTVSSTEENLNAEQLSLMSVYGELTGNEELIKMPFVLLPRYDEDYFKKLAKHKTHFVNVEAGGWYNLGWESGDGWDGRGLNWFGGINYGYYISKKISVSLGAQAFNLQNTGKAFYNGTTTEYAFGSSTSGTIITNNNMMFAAVPVRVYYAAGPFSQFGLGFNTVYAYNATNTFQSFALNDGVRSDVTTKTTTGVYNCTRQVSFMLSAFYKFQLGRRVALNAEYIYGLTDLFKNMGSITSAEKPQGLRLSLQYTLFDK